MRFATAADIPRIEQICNDPLMRVWSAFEGAPPCSAAKYVSAPSFSIVGDEGCLLAPHIEDGTFFIHVNLWPHCRGLAATRAGLEAIDLCFSRSELQVLQAAIPDSIPQSAWLARRFGFRKVADYGLKWPAGRFAFPIRVYVLARQQWPAARDRVQAETHLERNCHA